MENNIQEDILNQNQKTIIGGGHSKKSSKPTKNPIGGRSKGKSLVLANFEKNLKANSTNSTESKKIITGVDNEKFNNLRAMFEKKPEERQINDENENYGGGKIDPNKLLAFTGENPNQNDKKNSVLLTNDNSQSFSIQERIKMLMKSQEENKPQKNNNDPIMEKLKQSHLKDDVDENSEKSFSDDNLDISKGEDHHDNNLSKSEGLSDQEEKQENGKINEKLKNDENRTKNSKESRDDLNKSESLEDDF